MIKESKNLVAFLTIIPVGMDKDCLRDSARYMPLFPLVGVLIGSIAGIFAWALLRILPDLLTGTLTLGLLQLITGIHHADGLLDLGDGLMYHGPPEKKIKVMHDQRTGAGGLTLGLITLLATALSISGLDAGNVIQGLIVSETSAKLSMVVGAWTGNPAHRGMNTPFIKAMHSKYRKTRLTVSLAISSAVAACLLWTTGMTAVASGIITSLIMVGVSKLHFKGLTGDVLGGMNELARMASLTTILAVSR